LNKELLYQNKKIFCRVTGSGHPVVFIHGFGEDGEVWNNQVEFLKEKFQLIVPDLPGSGHSEMIDDMSMEGMAKVINHILHSISPDTSSFGRERAVLIGHSMGGYITLAFVEKYPGYLTGFGLFHSTAYADSDEKKAARRKGIDVIREKGAFEFLQNTTPNLFSQRTRDECPELISRQISRLAGFAPAALIAYYEAMIQRPDRTQSLKQSICPVLFIMGEQDTAIPLQDGLQQCHLPGRSCIHIFRKSGHMGMLEEAEKSNAALENFLRACTYEPDNKIIKQ
jgi:pimeloyl-ACP methyl ester carboxylesterase